MEYYDKFKNEFLAFYNMQDNKLDTLCKVHEEHCSVEKQMILEHDHILKDQITENSSKLLNDFDEAAEKKEGN